MDQAFNNLKQKYYELLGSSQQTLSNVGQQVQSLPQQGQAMFQASTFKMPDFKQPTLNLTPKGQQTLNTVNKFIPEKSALGALTRGQPQNFFPNLNKTIAETNKRNMTPQGAQDLTLGFMGMGGVKNVTQAVMEQAKLRKYGINPKTLEPAVNFLKNRITKEDVGLFGRFAAKVEKNPRANLGREGQQVASFARSIYGKEAENWSNKQLLSAINYTLQRIGQGKNSAGLGLNIRDVSKGLAKPGSKPMISGLEGGGVYHAEPNLVKLASKKAKDAERAVQQEFRQWQTQVFKQAQTQTPIKAVGQAVGAIKTGTSPLSKDIENLQDISGFSGQAKDVYRNFKSVFGNRFDEAKRVILDPFDKSKGAAVDMQKKWLGSLKTNIVDQLGIKPGSKESELTQLYGEKQITLDQLKQQTSKWQEVVQADKWFRNTYDTLLDEVNKARQAIYPNNPDKIIPKRSDYYRHFREMQEGLGGLKNIFENPSGITSSLSGVSEYAKPKSKFLSFAQKRLGMKSDIDAVGGFLNYIQSASYARHIDPHIERFRSLADELATQTTEGPNAGKLNNFIEFLQDYSNDLSGKTNPADRFVQKIIGRKAFSAINWLNNRVKANTILGNASSSIAQIFNVPQGIASVGLTNSLKGMGKSLASIFTENKPMQESTFLKERYFRGYDQFNNGILNDTKKFAAWMVGALDDVGSRFIWNSHYEKALVEGIGNPVKYADDMTRSLVAGRGVGEVPLVQKGKLFQLIAPFQLEVGNLWWVMKDMVDEKAFGKLATLFVANYVFNRGAEQVRGSGVTFDPIQAMLDAGGSYMQEEDKKTGAIKAGGRLTGEVLGNVPIAQNLAYLYPEYGNKDAGIPTRKEFFGKDDPTRFGQGLVLTKAMQDPLSKIIPPFGGSQIKKTLEGVQAYGKGYVGKENAVKYPVDQSVGNAAKMAAFGQYATPEGQNYFNTNQRPLSETQSALFQSVSDKAGSYKQMLGAREASAAETKIKEQLKASGGTATLQNKTYYLNNAGEARKVDAITKTGQYHITDPETGNKKFVDLSTPIDYPTLTGDDTIDKQLVSDYKSDLTARKKDIIALYQDGQLTLDQAKAAVSKVQAKYNSTLKGKKPKVIKVKAIKLKIPKAKTIKVKSIKPKKVKIYKLSKVKKIRTKAKLT